MNINITAHVLDDEGNEKVMTVTERLKEMDAPSDDEHIYLPHKLWICGSRFTFSIYSLFSVFSLFSLFSLFFSLFCL